MYVYLARCIESFLQDLILKSVEKAKEKSGAKKILTVAALSVLEMAC